MKDSRMVQDTPLINAQYYKQRIKGKNEQNNEKE